MCAAAMLVNSLRGAIAAAFFAIVTAFACQAAPLESPQYHGQELLDDSLDTEDDSNLKTLQELGLLPKPQKESKHWYEKMKIGGYAQIRFGNSFTQHAPGVDTSLFGDRSVSDTTGTFSIRRARLLITEDLDEHVRLQFQSDFANNPADGTNTYYAQIRDLYADIYLDTDKVNRFRVGQSKIPWGFEELQSSGLRVPLDRANGLDSGDSPNQRDLGVFYYWTPVDKQELLTRLVEDGLKGTGNYGIFALGFYNGQGNSQIDLNRSLHTVIRYTLPHELPSGQVVEVSLQGYTGLYVVQGEPIQPLGVGPAVTPAGVNPNGLREDRLATTFVWYPQPFGIQTEWNIGRGPGLNNAQTAVEVRSLSGGYIMLMHKSDTANHGTLIPFVRYQHYRGGYRSIVNAPFGTNDEFDVGCEWQISNALEIVTEYGYVDGLSLHPGTEPNVRPYQDFRGSILRCQMQVNY